MHTASRPPSPRAVALVDVLAVVATTVVLVLAVVEAWVELLTVALVAAVVELLPVGVDVEVPAGEVVDVPPIWMLVP